MKIYICDDYKNAKWRSQIPDGEKISIRFAKICVCDCIGRKQQRVNFKFAHNKYGKPYIKKLSRKRDGRIINRDIYFSLSHSADMLICAVSRYNIGADCQFINIKDIKICRKIAERFYSPKEILYLNNLPECEYINNFFEIWTMKEAYVKYTGKGLSEGLRTFDVHELDGVRFERILPELPGAYIYLCRAAQNCDELRVEYMR